MNELILAKRAALGVLLLSLTACGSWSGNVVEPLRVREGAKTVQSGRPMPLATGQTSGLLYWIVSASDVMKLRLPDGQTFRRKSYGSGGGVDIAIDEHSHLQEAFNDQSDAGGIVEMNQRLKVVRMVNVVGAIPLSLAIDEKGLQYLGCFDTQIEEFDIKVFAANATGIATPIRTIAGKRTGLKAITAMTADSAGYLYVANSINVKPHVTNNIEIFAPHAGGNKAPIRTISGDQTGLTGPRNLSLGADGNIYVSNTLAGSGNSLFDILVFPSGANGNVAPLRSLQSGPYGGTIALGTNGEMFVGFGPGDAGLKELPLDRGYKGGFAVYPPGASGNDPPSGYLGQGVVDASRVALQDPWYRL